MSTVFSVIDVEHMKAEQHTMSQWAEANYPDSEYVIFDEPLYSTQTPHTYASKYLRFVVLCHIFSQVMDWVHEEVDHMAIWRNSARHKRLMYGTL